MPPRATELQAYAMPAIVYGNTYCGMRRYSANGTSHSLEKRVAYHQIDVQETDYANLYDQRRPDHDAADLGRMQNDALFAIE